MQGEQEHPGQNFENVHAEHGSSVQRLTVTLPEDARGYLRWINTMSIALGLCFALGIVALIVAVQSEREGRMAEYYGVDIEVYLAKSGLHPPADPWGKFNKGERQ